MRGVVFEVSGALAADLDELSFGDAGQGDDDPGRLMIGPWTRAPAIASYDTRVDPLESVWRVALPRVDAASRAALDGGERSVARAHALLDAAPQRLERALATVALDGSELEPSAPGRLSRALQRAGDLARGRARIETHLAGALAARSVTTLSGDSELWSAPGLPRAGAELHARSVAVTLQTRRAWARLLAVTVACSGRIAALGLPAGLTALPLAWRFLRDLLRGVRNPDSTPAQPLAAGR